MAKVEVKTIPATAENFERKIAEEKAKAEKKKVIKKKAEKKETEE